MRHMEKKLNIAVVGATGAVGRAMVQTLEARRFPVGELTLLASERSAGRELHFGGHKVRVEKLDTDSFYGVDIALFSAGGPVSAQYAPIAVESGAVVVDNTAHFRMQPDVPLVVPEVNPQDIALYKKTGIIANPNCSTIQMLVAVAPLHKRFGIRRIVVDTYQAVSGAGTTARREMLDQSGALLSGDPLPDPVRFPKQIAFNCIPQIGGFLAGGYTEEEEKMMRETAKILGDTSVKVSATCVRVPVDTGHAESVNVEFHKDFTLNEVRGLWQEMPGLEVRDKPCRGVYPIQTEATGKDPVYVGRLRRDYSVDHGIVFWCVADNLLKGAALNAVQIAEILVREHLVRPS